jgi:hypothetical protein
MKKVIEKIGDKRKIAFDPVFQAPQKRKKEENHVFSVV